MIKLYDFPQSPYCQKVRLVLVEKDLSYDKVLVDLLKNEQKTAEFLRQSPQNRQLYMVYTCRTTNVFARLSKETISHGVSSARSPIPS